MNQFVFQLNRQVSKPNCNSIANETYKHGLVKKTSKILLPTSYSLSFLENRASVVFVCTDYQYVSSNKEHCPYKTPSICKMSLAVSLSCYHRLMFRYSSWSRTISWVFFTFRTRQFLSHHWMEVSISLWQDDKSMSLCKRLKMTVPSAYFMISLLVYVLLQSFVYKVKSIGDETQACATPVLQYLTSESVPIDPDLLSSIT